MSPVWRWTPAVVLGVAALFMVGIDAQRALPLKAELGESVPADINGLVGEDVAMEDWEIELAGVDDYLFRVYTPNNAATDQAVVTLYVGYYERQTGGRTIHSPKNCLPGSGWEALESRPVEISTDAGPVTVNRYLVSNGQATALVLYWYQGRGRVEANEYRVKWDLLRDATIRRRSEEALVRVVVPLHADEAGARSVAHDVAAVVIPALFEALPD